MNGDFSRSTFVPGNHYRAVFQQQGRVQLDADWNEQAEIVGHIHETTTGDVIGPTGGPYHHAAFAILCEDGPIGTLECQSDKLGLSAGRYYVDGILCENDHAVRLGLQPDLPGVPVPQGRGERAATVYLAYLDVWQHHVTVLERPELREVALGGPDTTTRGRTVWQVKWQPAKESVCGDFGPGWVPDGAASTGRLRARTAQATAITDPCLIPSGAGYRGMENQLYRVEMHAGSDAGGPPTFKWSRDDGSIAVGLEDITGTVLTISEPGKDSVLGFAADQWVELTDEGRTLRGERGVLVQLVTVQGTSLTVKAWPGSPVTMADFGTAPVVRRWDSDGELPLNPGKWLALENGVEVMFEGDPTQLFRTGDYWMFPARTANLLGGPQGLAGDIEWPRDPNGESLFQRRHGVEHHYAPVALLSRSRDSWKLVSDCRRLFPPLTELATLRYVGGDGQEAKPNHDIPGLLQVGVANGRWPVAGAKVRFVTPDGGKVALGHAELGLAGAADTVVAVTGDDGVASIAWRLNLDVGRPSQSVEAVLLDDQMHAVGLPVRFGGNLSIASEVAFGPPEACAVLENATTVQVALERLAGAAWLASFSGDGQAGLPGRVLPQPIVVQVVSDCGPVAGVTVVFRPGSGSVFQLEPTRQVRELPINSDANGLAACNWVLAAGEDRPVQQLVATLVPPANRPVRPPLSVTFTANALLDSQIAYTGDCEDLAGSGTVKGALDRLCRLNHQPGIRVVKIGFSDVPGSEAELRNDTQILYTQLRSGILITYDRPIAGSSVQTKPVMTVEVSVPYPLAPVDIQGPMGVPGAAFQRLALRAMPIQLAGKGAAMVWTPHANVLPWLAAVFQQLQAVRLPVSLVAHLTLNGNFIWAADDPNVFLDGDSFGVPDGTRTELRPFGNAISGNGRQGGDFRMWFTLIPPAQSVSPGSGSSGTVSPVPSEPVPGTAVSAASRSAEKKPTTAAKED